MLFSDNLEVVTLAGTESSSFTSAELQETGLAARETVFTISVSTDGASLVKLFSFCTKDS